MSRVQKLPGSTEGWQVKPEQASARLLVELAQTSKEMMEALSRDVGLSSTRLRLLGLLRRRGELSQAEVLQELLIDGGAVTRLVKAMEAEGMLTRRVAPDDNRFTLVALTNHGRTLADAAVTRSIIFEKDLTAGLSTDEINSLMHGLQRLRQNLRSREVGKE